MNSFKLNVVCSVMLATTTLFSANSSAALIGTQTATVDFGSTGNNPVAAAVYGKSNESGGNFTGDCTSANCYVQNGVVVGGVNDPSDPQAHLHRQGSTSNRELQYHPDSTGMYVRLSDKSNFSLQSIYINVTNGAADGNFKLYGYTNAINDGLLTEAGESPIEPGNGFGSSSDPEGGNTPFIASYNIPNDGAFDQTISFLDLISADSDWGNIGAFWLTFEGFNHSPTTNYAEGSYPDWDARIDNIVLGAPVPVPAAVWLFGTGLIGLFARSRKVTV